MIDPKERAISTAYLTRKQKRNSPKRRGERERKGEKNAWGVSLAEETKLQSTSDHSMSRDNLQIAKSPMSLRQSSNFTGNIGLVLMSDGLS